MKETLELYAKHRKTHYEIIEECDTEISDITKKVEKAATLLKQEEKKFQRASWKKEQEKKKKLAERKERRRERKEQRPEHPTNVYRVRITIEVPVLNDADQDSKAHPDPIP